MKPDSPPLCGVTGFGLSQPSPLDMSWQPTPCCLLLTRPGMENQEISFLAAAKRMPCLSEASSLPYSENYLDVQSCRTHGFLLLSLKGT